MGNISNPMIVGKGDSFSVDEQALLSMTPTLASIKDANEKVVENLVTTGVNEMRAIPIQPNKAIDLDAIAKKAQEMRTVYKNLGQKAADEKKESKEFITGSSAPTENYDLNVDTDDEKRTKDNLRDESGIERPFEYDKLKPFAKTKANLMMKMKKIESLLTFTRDRTQRNRLHYLQARISNDLQKMSGMETTKNTIKWTNPEPKSDPDIRKDEEKMMRPENTGEIKNTINDELKKANLQAWSMNPKIKKKALEEFDKVQKQNIEQTITELSKNDEEYKKDIELLELAIGKKAEVSREDTDEIENKEKDEIGDKDKDKDKKVEIKDKGTKDKKDSKPTGKPDIKERMKKMREKRKMQPKAPMVGDEEGKIGPPASEEGIAGSPEKKPMRQAPPMRDDLTAEFTRQKTKASSTWEIKDNENKTILKFTGAGAYGKNIFKEWKLFTSKDYGRELLARIRRDGLEEIAGVVNGKIHITQHAAFIQANAEDDAKVKKEKKEKVKKEKEDKEVKEKKEKEEKAKKDKEKKEAKASPAISDYFSKYLGKGTQKVPSFKSKITERVNKTTTASKRIDPKTLIENKNLRVKIASLEAKLENQSEENKDLKDTSILRARAEKSLKLSQIMIDKKIIKAQDLEKTVEKLTIMDDIAYAMMEDMVGIGNFGEQLSEHFEKKAFKQKGGLSHLMLMPSANRTLTDKFTNMFMSKPKYAKLQESLKNFYK